MMIEISLNLVLQLKKVQEQRIKDKVSLINQKKKLQNHHKIKETKVQITVKIEEKLTVHLEWTQELLLIHQNQK